MVTRGRGMNSANADRSLILERSWRELTGACELLALDGVRLHLVFAESGESFWFEWGDTAPRAAAHWMTSAELHERGRAIGSVEFIGRRDRCSIERCSAQLPDLVSHLEETLHRLLHGSTRAA